jgi:Protein of unknown function (DUF4242)
VGDVSDAAKPGWRTFLVEHYWPGVTEAEFAAAAERVRASAAELGREGMSVRYLHSTLVPDDESAFCVFEAESAAAVAEAYTRAGLAYERLRDALQIRRDPSEPGGRAASATTVAEREDSNA